MKRKAIGQENDMAEINGGFCSRNDHLVVQSTRPAQDVLESCCRNRAGLCLLSQQGRMPVHQNPEMKLLFQCFTALSA